MDTNLHIYSRSIDSIECELDVSLQNECNLLACTSPHGMCWQSVMQLPVHLTPAERVKVSDNGSSSFSPPEQPAYTDKWARLDKPH